jgi:hypothetical protein
MCILLRHGWQLFSTRQSRLFVQANHPDVTNKSSDIVKKMASSNYTLLDMIDHVSLDMYINQSNSDFKPKQHVKLRYLLRECCCCCFPFRYVTTLLTETEASQTFLKFVRNWQKLIVCMPQILGECLGWSELPRISASFQRSGCYRSKSGYQSQATCRCDIQADI